MVKLKKDGTPKKSGGDRPGAGAPKKLNKKKRGRSRITQRSILKS